jgi:mono/diheme cytochrome c family protein
LRFVLPAVLVLGLIAYQPQSRSADKDETRTVPGLHLTLEAPGKNAVDHRSSRLVSLHVPAGESASPFLPPGPFRAVWKAGLELELKGDFTFSAEGNGKLTLLINDAVVLECSGDDFRKTPAKKIELKRENRLEVRYDSPDRGDAFVRLYWAGDDFPREPLGLAAAQHDSTVAPLASARQMRQGRELIAELHCLKCHQSDLKGMPDLERDGPSFAEIGARLKPSWMARWIQDPQALRPTATMPRLLKKDDPGANDIAAYLASLGVIPKDTHQGDEKAIAAGTRLFVHLGCFACHVQPGRDDAADEHKRIPLRDVGSKYHPSALRDFLRHPGKHYTWIRMPDFHLSEAEATSLTAFLLSVKPRDPGKVERPAANAEHGKQLVQSLGCLNCHSLNEKKPSGSTLRAPAFVALESTERGCLAVKDHDKAPLFALSDGQREALRLCLRNGRSSLSRESAAEFAERQIVALRCAACHKRDGADDLMSSLKEEADGLLADLPAVTEKEGMFSAEQARPSLTWIGEKLKPEWTAAFLAGKVKYKPRTWLRARMPAFPVRAELLARGLALEHGYPAISPADPMPDEKRAEVGRNLASKTRWNCAGCHNIGSTAAVGVFEAPGVNFMFVRERMRRDYFDRWVWSPTRVEPGTKMPTIYSVGQPSQIKDVLGGDAHKQIDALWNYLLQGDRIKPPEQ